MRRHTEAGNPCAIDALLEILTRPWTMHILWVLTAKHTNRI